MDRNHKDEVPRLDIVQRVDLLTPGCCPGEDMSVEGQFNSGADLQEGISGRKSIHTKYENDLPLSNIKSRSVK